MNDELFNKPLVIERHWIVPVVNFLRFFIVLMTWLTLFVAVLHLNEYIWISFRIFLLIDLLAIVNYAFLMLIFRQIEHLNNLLIFYKDKLIIYESSLVLKDDIEIIHIYSINKFQRNKHWLIQNIFGYWDIIIEQQNDSTKIIRYVKDPTIVIRYLELLREFTVQESKKKFIIHWKNE